MNDNEESSSGSDNFENRPSEEGVNDDPEFKNKKQNRREKKHQESLQQAQDQKSVDPFSINFDLKEDMNYEDLRNKFSDTT